MGLRVFNNFLYHILCPVELTVFPYRCVIDTKLLWALGVGPIFS